MSDAERMARAFRTALHNCNNTWEDFNDTSRMRSVYRDYVAAAQSLLDAGWRLPLQETTVNETTHIGGWEKLTGIDLRPGRYGEHDIGHSQAEAVAINGCIELLTKFGFTSKGEPQPGQIAWDARERLAPLGITAETLRAKATLKERVEALRKEIEANRYGASFNSCNVWLDESMALLKEVEDNNASK